MIASTNLVFRTQNQEELMTWSCYTPKRCNLFDPFFKIAPPVRCLNIVGVIISPWCDLEVIFVCGDAHIESFRELLERNGVSSDVLHRGIGVSQRDGEFWHGVIRYLEAHPELSR